MYRIYKNALDYEGNKNDADGLSVSEQSAAEKHISGVER